MKQFIGWELFGFNDKWPLLQESISGSVCNMFSNNNIESNRILIIVNIKK